MRFFFFLQIILLGRNVLLCNSFFTPRHKQRFTQFLHMKKINVYQPRTENQQLYWNDLENSRNKLIIANGAAGTGKTLLACQHAVKDLFDGKIEKIVITRPVVPVEEEIGFLPGTLQKKMDPWTRPIMDIFNDFYSKTSIKNMLKEDAIEISPLGFMRGRTFKNSIIIADEMQNSSPNQMLMLLTRIGENSRIVITGDLKQCDKDRSGLNDLVRKLNIYYSDDVDDMRNDGIVIHTFKSEDVQRSGIVAKILDIYE